MKIWLIQHKNKQYRLIRYDGKVTKYSSNYKEILKCPFYFNVIKIDNTIFKGPELLAKYQTEGAILVETFTSNQNPEMFI